MLTPAPLKPLFPLAFQKIGVGVGYFCKIADNRIYKPYAIIIQEKFDAEVRNLQKRTPF